MLTVPTGWKLDRSEIELVVKIFLLSFDGTHNLT